MNYYKHLMQRQEEGNPIRIGVIGAGKFSRMFLSQARITPGVHVVGIASLHPKKAKEACLGIGYSKDFLSYAESTDKINDGASEGKTMLTGNADGLIKADLDVVLEITGVPEAGAHYAWTALEAKKHVIMVNVEADALLGVALKKKAVKERVIYSMAYGDQPALIAQQVDWARTVGLEVTCAGKGTRYQPEFHYSTPDTVWRHYGFTDEQVTSGGYNAKMFNSFLDGTKSAVEMCAVANATGLVPQKCGLQFPPVGIDKLADVLKPKSAGGILEHDGTVEVIASENRDKTSLDRDLRWGVYVVYRAPSDYVKRCFKEYGMRTDSSGYYSAIFRPYHLIGLELGISVASVVLNQEATGSAESFIADVACVAKKNLKPGEILDGEGGYTVYGRLVRAKDSIENRYFPIGLSNKAKIVKPVAKGEILTYDDVRVNPSFAFELRKNIELGKIR